MKRKDFIKYSATFAAGAALFPMISCRDEKNIIAEEATARIRKNWAGNFTYTADNLFDPS